MNTITNIRDAKVLRAVGLPLNMEVEDGGPLPEDVEKTLEEGMKAAIKFRGRLYDFIKNRNASTQAALEKAFQRFMAKTEPPEDDWITATLLRHEFDSIRAEWSEAFELMHAGEAVDIKSMWPFVPTEAQQQRAANPDL